MSSLALVKSMGENLPVLYQGHKLYEVASGLSNSTSVITASKYGLRLLLKTCYPPVELPLECLSFLAQLGIQILYTSTPFSITLLLSTARQILLKIE